MTVIWFFDRSSRLTYLTRVITIRAKSFKLFELKSTCPNEPISCRFLQFSKLFCWKSTITALSLGCPMTVKICGRTTMEFRETFNLEILGKYRNPPGKVRSLLPPRRRTRRLVIICGRFMDTMLFSDKSRWLKFFRHEKAPLLTVWITLPASDSTVTLHVLWNTRSGTESMLLLSSSNSRRLVKLDRAENTPEFNRLCFMESLLTAFVIGDAAMDEISCSSLLSMVRTRMLVRFNRAAKDGELRPLPDKSSSSSRPAKVENASRGITSSLLSSNFRLVRLWKDFKPDASASLRSMFWPRSSTLAEDKPLWSMCERLLLRRDTVLRDMMFGSCFRLVRLFESRMSSVSPLRPRIAWRDWSFSPLELRFRVCRVTMSPIQLYWIDSRRLPSSRKLRSLFSIEKASSATVLILLLEISSEISPLRPVKVSLVTSVSLFWLSDRCDNTDIPFRPNLPGWLNVLSGMCSIWLPLKSIDASVSFMNKLSNVCGSRELILFQASEIPLTCRNWKAKGFSFSIRL